MLETPALEPLAQRVVEGDLQQQMSPAEFKAAGLDKLNAQELATLKDESATELAREVLTYVAMMCIAGVIGFCFGAAS